MKYILNGIILFTVMNPFYCGKFEDLCKPVDKDINKKNIVKMATPNQSVVVSEVVDYTRTYINKQPDFTGGHLETVIDDNMSNAICIKKMHIEDWKKILTIREVQMLKYFKGNFAVTQIVKGRQCIYDNEYSYILLEKLNYNLVQFIFKKMKDRSDYIFWQFMTMMNIAHALSKLHDNKIIHRDINFFNLYMRNKYDVAIGDLMFAIDENKNYDSIGYNSKILEILDKIITYPAPEIGYAEFTFKSDIYSLGVVYYFLSIPDFIKDDKFKKEFKMSGTIKDCMDTSAISIKKIAFCVFTRPLIQELLSNSQEERPTTHELILKINGTIECFLFHMFKENWGHEEFIDPLLVSECEKFNTALEYFTEVKDMPTIDGLQNFLSDFKKSLDKNYNYNQPHALELIKNNAIFFNALPDSGESILGSPIYKYISSKTEDAKKHNEVKPKNKCFSRLCSLFKSKKLVI